MKQEKIFAISKKPGGSAEIRLMEREPKAFSLAVDGKREVIPFPGLPGVCVLFDGEAGATKKPNCFLPEYNDMLTGTVIAAGIDFDKGFVSLNERQAASIEEYLKTNDAKGFNGNAGEKIAAGYLPGTEENFLLGTLCEVKTKYKNLKFKWMSRR
jgi:hypothetical protein